MNSYFHSKLKEKPVPSYFPKGPLPRAIPAVAMHTYKPRDALELSLTRNQRLHIVEAKGDWWFLARSVDGSEEGWVASSYIHLLESPQSLDSQATYCTWASRVAEAFGPQVQSSTDPETPKLRLDTNTFPFPPASVCTCQEPGCSLRKKDCGLGACVHDVEELVRGVEVDEYCAAWLWKQRLAWHPDRFVGRFAEGFEDVGGKAVGEMFMILTELSVREKEKEKEG